jgi:hypothetical protein
MRKLQPYVTVRGAQAALDNGGRFYNLFSKPSDDVVDPAELARAAGVISAGTQAFLFFEMALFDLPASEKERVVSLLSPALRERYAARRPAVLAPSVVESEGRAGRPAIVSGYPVFLEDRTQFTGFIMVPTGRTLIMVPIFDRFDVYEVYDTPDRDTPRTVIATTRGSKRLDGIHARFGGMLRELHFEDVTGKEHALYLEALYYTPLG